MGDKDNGPAGPRCIALVGPFQSGKTTLLEAILSRTGAIARQGTVEAGTTVGDASKEARHHKMSVEVTVATTTFMDDSYTFIDCPGSVEFVHDMRAVLPAVDAAVVVCEADDRKVAQLQLILRELEDLKIPRFLFLNKIDKTDKQVRESLAPAAAGVAGAAVAAADTDLEERHRQRVRRPGAGARLRLPRTRALRGDRARRRGARFREGCAFHHAGDARRPRRRADGAIARRRAAAARPRVRRSRQGIARWAGLPGADGRRHPHQRRAAPLEGAASRGAGRGGDRQAARRQGQWRCGGNGAEDVPHHARRQAVGGAGALRPDRRRRDLELARGGGGPGLRRIQAHRTYDRKARTRGGRRNRRASASSNTPRPATRCPPASSRMPPWRR